MPYNLSINPKVARFTIHVHMKMFLCTAEISQQNPDKQTVIFFDFPVPPWRKADAAIQYEQ